MKSILLAGLLAVAGSLAFGADAAYWKEQLLGTAYIWNGGATGTWDATTENWIGLDGNPAVWEDGQAAAFLEEADITVSGTKQVADIHTAAPVTFTGDDVHVLDDSGIYWQEDSALTFNSNVLMGTNVQTHVRGDIETAFDPQTGYLSETEELLILPGKTIADMIAVRDSAEDSIRVSMNWIYYTLGTSVLETVPTTREDGLVLTASADGKSAVGYLRYKVTDSWGGIVLCTKILFTEKEDGVYAIVEWVRYVIPSYGDLTRDGVTLDSVWDVDFETWSACRTGSCVSADEDLPDYSTIRIFNFQMVNVDPAPTTMTMQVNGNYENAGRVYIDGVTFIINGTYNCETGPLPNFRMSNGGSVAIGPDAAVTLATLGTQDGENRFWDGPLNIYSPVLLNNSRSGGYGPYCIFANCPAVNIWDGGSITLIGNVYYQYGIQGMILNVYTGGVFRATDLGQLGYSTTSVSLYGGTIINEYDLLEHGGDHFMLYTLRMEGGRIEGASAEALYANYNRASTWTIAGTEPSVVATDNFRVGGNNTTISSTSGESWFFNLIVNDVTGDEAADLLISSRFFLAPNAAVAEDGYSKIGMRKQGAGTLELSGTGSESLGMFHVQEGLVRFTDEATFTGMKLSLEGGDMDFGASTNISFRGWSLSTNAVLTVQNGSVDLGPLESWTDGATLYVKGAEMTNRSLRVGEDANALTEAQLASCWYIREDGALRKMTLSADGYLAPPAAATIIFLH